MRYIVCLLLGHPAGTSVREILFFPMLMEMSGIRYPAGSWLHRWAPIRCTRCGSYIDSSELRSSRSQERAGRTAPRRGQP